MTAIATVSQTIIEKCRNYWFERPHDYDNDPPIALCKFGSQPPLQCMSDQSKCCKGQMLVGLTDNLPTALAEIEERLLWHAVFGGEQELNGNGGIVKASFLQWLFTNRRVVELVSNNGIRVKNITIEGDLNLDNVTIGFPVEIVDSRFRGITLTDATTRSINFEGSECDYLRAARIRITGRLRLAGSKHNCFRANGPVDLTSSQISGDLDCLGGHFKASADNRDAEPWALKAELANIRGSVLLADTLADTKKRLRFQADGQIYALEMTVGGNFDCTNARISNLTGERHAISLDRSKIDGCVFLRNGFSAKGEVRLIGTQIIGDLDCSGGTFSNDEDGTRPIGVALEARNTRINNSVYLCGSLNKSAPFGKPNSSFQADGLISFDGAYIGHNLFIGKHDDNEDKIINNGDEPGTILHTDEINIRNAEVGGSMRCMADFHRVTRLRLDNTNVDRLVMISKDKLWPKDLSLTRFGYNYIRFQDEDDDDLCLMSVDTADGLVNEGRNLVLVALVGTHLHVRIFDANGKRVVDKAEDELMSGDTLTTLKKQLHPLPKESDLSQKQKQEIIRNAKSIAGHIQDDHNAGDTPKDKCMQDSHVAMQKRGKGNCFTNWLECDKSYSPQQYEYLAELLKKLGSPKEANTVLRASRERLRAELRKQDNRPRLIPPVYPQLLSYYKI